MTNHMIWRDVDEILNLLDKFSKNTETFVTNRPVGTEGFHAERETDVKLIVALPSSATPPKTIFG